MVETIKYKNDIFRFEYYESDDIEQPTDMEQVYDLIKEKDNGNFVVTLWNKNKKDFINYNEIKEKFVNNPKLAYLQDMKKYKIRPSVIKHFDFLVQPYDDSFTGKKTIEMYLFDIEGKAINWRGF